MKKFICLVMLVAVALCCFVSCGSDTTSAAEVETEQKYTYGLVETQPTDPGSTTTDNDEPEQIIGTTDTIVTDYAGCWIVLPDGRVIRGTVVSWMIVNEYLIQVTLKDMNIVGTRQSWEEGEINTYLVAVDRVYFYTD